jgi:hypothetical protein
MGYALKYKVGGPTLAAFIKHRPEALGESLPIDVITGPIGSGKSGACCMRIFLHACEQPPGADGWRRTKWAVVRNTNPELKTTTIPEWLSWFPEEHFGPFNWSPPYNHLIRLPDMRVEIELWFVPMDDMAALKKVLSWNLTGAWVNEAREVMREVIIQLRSRCGRFPALKDLADPTKPGWAGVICDTNTPEDELHYLCMWAGITAPPDWMDNTTRALMTKPAEVTIFQQPPGLLPVRDAKGDIQTFKVNPKAENIQHLRPGYYMAQLPGNTSSWVLNMVCCEVRRAADERLVYPDFRREVHVSAERLEFDPRHPSAALLIGGDFARNPAFVFGQEVDGQLRILREFVGINVDVASFTATTVMPQVNTLWPDAKRRGWGDPSGSHRTGGDDSTAFLHAREGGLTLVPAHTNDPDQRQRAVTRRLQRMGGGRPALIIDPTCTTLIGGFAGGYKFQRLKVEGTLDEYKDEPKKNLFSHIQDALQYLCLGLDRGSGQTQEEQRRAARHAGPLPNGARRFDPLAKRSARAYAR